ncbi:uncharacterized protein LOC131044898 [Cryptomeria japonica]|uniref:uncharacterized protein LOC131044898 n=1 Tax=Cryptomeria japonica TaxID=3369 RepID=UPI0027DA17F8|nr:uncharacterized protein LOC131044898 [Cryptomeria japonica]
MEDFTYSDQGELETYDRHLGTIVVQRIFADNVLIEDGSVAWEDIAALYEHLPSVLSGIVGGLLCPDRRSHRLIVDWGQFPGRVMRQFGWRQGLPRGSGEYARVVRERFQWRPVLFYHQVVAEFRTLQISEHAEPIPPFEDDRKWRRRRRGGRGGGVGDGGEGGSGGGFGGAGGGGGGVGGFGGGGGGGG